jgi:hypothetical protein
MSSRDPLAATLIACTTAVLKVYLLPISASKKYILTIHCPYPQVISGDARFAPPSQETLQHRKFVFLQYRTKLKRYKKFILASEGIEPPSPTKHNVRQTQQASKANAQQTRQTQLTIVLQEQHVVGILPIELQSLCFGFR